MKTKDFQAYSSVEEEVCIYYSNSVVQKLRQEYSTLSKPYFSQNLLDETSRLITRLKESISDHSLDYRIEKKAKDLKYYKNELIEQLKKLLKMLYIKNINRFVSPSRKTLFDLLPEELLQFAVQVRRAVYQCQDKLPAKVMFQANTVADLIIEFHEKFDILSEILEKKITLQLARTDLKVKLLMNLQILLKIGINLYKKNNFEKYQYFYHFQVQFNAYLNQKLPQKHTEKQFSGSLNAYKNDIVQRIA